MVLIAAVVLGSWILLSVLALSLCVAAGGADRALDLMVAPAPPQEPIACDFVAGFAEPEPTAAPDAPRRAVSPTRT
jgi:hypothetical protein